MRFSLPPHIAWPMFIIALLLMGMVATMYTVVIANRTPPQVVENYYEKALAWDEQQAQTAASEALGWTLNLSVEGQTAGPRAIAVSLRDASGALLTDLTGTIRAHRPDQIGAQAEQPLTVRADGTYEVQMTLPKTGLWDFEVIAERHDERFTQTVRREIYQ